MKNIKTLSIYGIAHLLVDAICVGGMLTIFEIQTFPIEKFIFYIFLYNIIAFASQMIIGYFVDEIQTPKQIAILGIIVSILGVTILKIPILATIVLGIGNGLFHVGGGIISFYTTPKEASGPGIFVAPGAIGVLVGTVINKTYIGLGSIVILLVIMLYLIYKDEFNNSIVYEKKYPNIDSKFIYLIMSLLFVVCVRALIGGAIIFSWKMDMIDKVLIVSFIFLGKALGGILGDKFGFEKIGIGGLIASSILLTIDSQNMYLGLLGIFAFNLTMPITLTILANGFKKYKGFAFGLTATALVVGFIFDYVIKQFYVENGIIIFVLVILSAFSLKFGAKMKERV